MIMSELLRLLTKYEQMSESLIRSFFEQKTSNSLGKPMSEFSALAVLKKSESLAIGPWSTVYCNGQKILAMYMYYVQ